MKKLVLFSCVLLSACALFQKEERFQNPLFYRQMRPISDDTVQIRLTPTKIYSIDSIVPEMNCKLLKNSETIVDFSCDFYNPLSGWVSDELYRFELDSNDPSFSWCHVARQKFKGGESYFCIPKNE